MTPAVDAAKRAGIQFRLHEYDGIEVGDGDYALAVATALGRPPGQLFKTLVVSVDGDLRAFVLPADRQLDLRGIGKRAQLARGLDALVLRVRELPVAREAAIFLVGDVDLAWRLFALALLAEELGG